MSGRIPMASPSPAFLSASSDTEAITGFQLSKFRCRVHPSVIITMLDAHSRLREATDFAIGTLLGTVTTDGGTKASGIVVVEILDCFVNPYHWDRTTTALTIQKEQHEWMLKLREKINSKLSVVGWCCTTNTILYTTALSDWARSEQKVSRFHPTKIFPEPVHILINPLFNNQLSILNETKAYIRGPLRQLFHEIPLDISLNPSDNEGVASILKYSSNADKQPSPTNIPPQDTLCLQDEVGDLATALRKLQSFIAPCSQYIEGVLHGEPGDVSIGRALMRAVCVETLLPQNEIESMCEGSMQDNLMIAFLTNLARLQFTAAEKLNTSFN